MTCGSESLTLNKREKNRVVSIEIKVSRRIDEKTKVDNIWKKYIQRNSENVIYSNYNPEKPPNMVRACIKNGENLTN